MTIKEWKEKLEHLRKAEAIVSDAMAKFAIQQNIKEAELKLSELLQQGIADGELGVNAVDDDLLKLYFSECAKYDPIFKPHMGGEIDARDQYLLANGFAYQSPKGALALTEDGIFFCAQRDRINSKLFDFDVVLLWYEGKTANQEQLWGSVLYLYQELTKRLAPLTARVMGNPEKRNAFGGEVEIHEYPPVAMTEALTNFLIHRDYRIIGDHARVQIYNDCIEFINPGLSIFSPDELLSATKDLVPVYSRNKVIIKAMSRARLNQRMGSGILRIRDKLIENGNFLPDGSLGLKLYNDTERCRFHLTMYRRDLTQVPAMQNLRSLLTEEGNLVFLFGAPAAGKTSVLGSIIQAMQRPEAQGRLFVHGAGNSRFRRGLALWDRIRQCFDCKQFPSRTISGETIQLHAQYKPQNSEPLDVIFLEMAGEDLKRVMITDKGDRSLPFHIDQFLRVRRLKMIFVIMSEWREAGNDDSLIDDFLAHLNETASHLIENRIVLLITKWDSNPAGGGTSIDAFVRKNMPKTYNKIAFARNIIQPFSIGKVIPFEDEGGDIIASFDYLASQRLFARIYETFTGRASDPKKKKWWQFW